MADENNDAQKKEQQQNNAPDDDDIETDDGPQVIEPENWNRPRDARGTAQRVWEQRGGAPKAIQDYIARLLWDNHNTRVKLSKAKSRIVGEKDVLLKDADADAYREIEKLQLKPTEIKERLEQRDKLVETQKQHEHEKIINEIADAMGFTARGKKAFVRQAKLEGLDLKMKEVAEENDEGKKVRVLRPHAKLLTESDDKLRPLDDFLEEELGDLLPAFYAEDEKSSDASERESVTRTHTPERRGTPMVEQSRSAPRRAGKGGAAVVKQTLDSIYEPEKAKAK